ncbi:calcium homeostasis modulator protein 6-like [Notamacropus eugenii]|uniref:calcium homeostasis modulator protein 6-like n=1 Tax=Notamacropus eugenii TaxID=9315 RepID=UPI003B67B78A
MKRFNIFLGLLTKHHRALGMSFLSLLIAGGESLFSNVVFQCPCNATWNLPYSLFFVLVPALVLFLLGYLLSSKAKHMMTGCWAEDQKDTSDKPGPGKCSRRAKRCCKIVCSQITWSASVAPFTWIAVALLGGNYYECGVSGSVWMQKSLCSTVLEQMFNCSEKVVQMPCQKTNPTKSEEIQGILKMFRAHSQMIGWGSVAVIMFFFMLAKFCPLFSSQFTFLQLKFQKIYKKEEKKMLTTELKRHATELAQRNVKCFFENVFLDSVKIPGSDEWKKISVVIDFTDPAYTVLHEYLNKQSPERQDDHQRSVSH